MKTKLTVTKTCIILTVAVLLITLAVYLAYAYVAKVPIKAPDSSLTFFPTCTEDILLVKCTDPVSGFRFSISFKEMENIRKAAAISFSAFLETQKLISENVMVPRVVITDLKTGEIRMETDKEYLERRKKLDREREAWVGQYEEILQTISRPLIDKAPVEEPIDD